MSQSATQNQSENSINPAELFSVDTIYISDKDNAQDALTEIAQDLREKDLITEGFLPNLLEREKSFPTGMDMSPLGPDMPNFAIPHTETEYVLQTRIVPVKLEKPITWHNMLNPADELPVSFLFMILNASKEAQTGLLAAIMDFAAQQGPERFKEFVELNEPQNIYNYLVENFGK